MTSPKVLKTSIAFACVLLIPFSGWSQDEELARKELKKRNIPFGVNAFVERARGGDNAAVQLFLLAGMNPDRKSVV